LKYLLLLLCGCVSSAGITTSRPIESFTETGANQNGTEAKQHPGGLLYFRSGNTYQITTDNHNKVYKKAQSLCSPLTVIPLVDDYFDLPTRAAIQAKKQLIFEYECR